MTFARLDWCSAGWHWWVMQPRRHGRTSALASPRPPQKHRRWQKRFRITITLIRRLLSTTPSASCSVSASCRTLVHRTCPLSGVKRTSDSSRLSCFVELSDSLLRRGRAAYVTTNDPLNLIFAPREYFCGDADWEASDVELRCGCAA